MKTPVFQGCATALVTPFRTDGTLDLPAYRDLIRRQIASEIDAVVLCGTTGESAVLSCEERRVLIEEGLRIGKGRVPMIVGTGSNSTAAAIALSQEAQKLGADALLVVTPYYNKATQSGLVRHYLAIADAVELPLIVYNVPSRTGLSCTAETYRTLAAHPNIVGVKEASGDFTLIQKTRVLCPDFCVWSGNDEDTAAVCALGGKGVISVVSNLLPREIHTLTKLCLSGDFAQGGAMQLRLFPLIRALFCEVNPIPVKQALAALGLCENTLRLPLCAMQEDNCAALLRTMQELGLLDIQE